MKLTPAMRQYMEVKEEYPDAIVLFRMGDFYECFYEDAKNVSRILGITLTSRGKDETKAPLAGIPYHALDKYMKPLVESGFKIAICEQLEDPKKAKGVVKRGVTRVITAGTVVEESVLHDKTNNYLASVFIDGKTVGFAVCDISTGEFLCAEFESKQQLLIELARFSPSEIITPSGFSDEDITNYAKQLNILLHSVHEFYYFLPKSEKILYEQFNRSVAQLGFSQLELAVCASGSLIHYLKETQKLNLNYIKSLQKYSRSDYMEIDSTTLKNLELLKTINDGSKKRTLFSTIDKTRTSMGSRLLKKWIIRPLIQKEQIQKRLQAVESLVLQQITLEELHGLLEQIADIERLLSRITYGQANARDLLMLKNSLSVIPSVVELLTPNESQLIQSLIQFSNIGHLVTRIDQAIKDECPITIREGNFIKRGFNKELDELWEIKDNAKHILAKIEKEESEKTGISTLKIKYNRVFGYFIEVTNRFKDKVPDHYIRKQSTVNNERFITEELKELEHKILTAQDKIQEIEYQLFMRLCDDIKSETTNLQDNALQIATLDCIASLARASILNNYVYPQFTDDFKTEITDSRHAVVEQEVPNFIENDCHFSEEERMVIITGPNMAGKSTYMRQIALLHILAQVGCFIPAKSATLSIVDKVFTRVGAYDDVSKGQSTFMVEMSETAYILHNATRNSLVIFDEIGSGTSTYDGVAIAWAVALDIAKRIKCKSLFATHYHVLTKLDEEPGVVNYNIAVQEKNDEIIFLRKIIKGGTDKSYGLHVAKLAGLPQSVVENAHKIQLKLESDDILHDRIVVEKRLVSHAKDVDKIEYAKLKQRGLGEYDE